jgi:predicted HTH transcriptional regulator
MSNEYVRFLEQLIENKPIRESEAVELKPSLTWNLGTVQVKKIMRTILAFSNKSGGGKIVLGIPQDNTSHEFIDTGMTDSDYSSFADSDRIYQDAGNYGEPTPVVETVRTEYKGKKYVVINVLEFYASPVICKQELINEGKRIIERGLIYIRTPKPECKKVEHENEMRQVIDMAVNKEIVRFNERISLIKKVAYTENPDDDNTKFEKEKEDFK